MKTGLLWFDNDAKRPLEIKIEQGAQRYHQKFGVWPNACLVNPAALVEKETRADGVRIIPTPDILPHHFLLGMTKNHRPKGSSHSESGDSKR